MAFQADAFQNNAFQVSGGNALPVGSITYPIHGSTLTSIPITVTATLSDPDGTVIQARLLEDNGPIGTDLAAPWEWTWNPMNGTKTLAVEMTDDALATALTANVVVTIEVPPPAPPPPPPPPGSGGGYLGMLIDINARR